MDFIERWFGIYPDGGTGALEMVYLVMFAVGGALARHWCSRRRPQSALTGPPTVDLKRA